MAKDEKSCFYTYEIDLKFYFKNVNNDEITVPSLLLTKGTKRFNFVENFYPIWEGSCYINIRYLEPMRVNRDKIYAVLRVIKKRRNTGENMGILSTEELFTDRFIPFFTDDSFPNYARETDLEPVDSKGNKTLTTSNMASALNHEVKFALFSENALNFNKVNVNFNAKECDVGTAIKYIIHHSQQTNNIKPKVIIDNPSNKNKYKFITVPSHIPSMAFKWLQVRYGIYDTGLTAFYDSPNLYILNKYATIHDKKKDSISKIVLEIFTDPNMAINPSAIYEKDNTVTLKVAQNPTKMDSDIFISELIGNEIIYSNYSFISHALKFKEGEYEKYNIPYSLIRKPTNKHVKSLPKARVDYDELNNPINTQAFLKGSSLHTIITIGRINTIPLEVVRPNTIVQIKIKDDENKDLELSGLYTIVSGDIIFAQDNNDKTDYITELHNLVLIKIDE